MTLDEAEREINRRHRAELAAKSAWGDKAWAALRHRWPEWLRRERPQTPAGSAYELFRAGAIHVPRLPEGVDG